MLPGEIKVWRYLNWPNRISLLRLLLVPPLLLLLINQQEWPWARPVAVALAFAMGLSDGLDGLLARRLHARSRFGAILDPLADKVLIISSVIVLSLPDSCVPGARIPNIVVVTIVAKDLWVIGGFLVVLLATNRFRIQPTLAGKASTLGQLMMLGFTLIAPDINAVWRGAGSRLALALAWVAAGLSVLAAISYTRLGLRFVAHEQMPYEEQNQSNVSHHESH